MHDRRMKSFFAVAMIFAVFFVLNTFEVAQGMEKVEDFYKGRVLKIVVPFAPGGGFDQWARGLAPYLKKYTGANVVVENWEGAGGLVGGASCTMPPNRTG